MKIETKKVYVFFILLTLIFSLMVGIKRSVLENNFKQVEIVMSLNKIRELSIKDGKDENEILRQAKIKGITGIAIQEDTITTLLLQSKIAFFSPNDLNKFDYFHYLDFPRLNNISNNSFMIACQDYDLFQRLKENIQSFLGEDFIKTSTIDGKYYLQISQGDEEELLKLGLGYSKEDILKIQQMAFNLILRPKNTSKINQDIFQQKLQSINNLNDIALIIFDEEEVLGYPSLKMLTEMANFLEKKNYSFGIIEFTSQKGIQTIASKISELAVRVHSITKEEMEKIDQNKAIDRWVRAAQERNIRLFYLNPFLNIREGSLVESNLDYIGKIKDELIKNNYRIGKASLFPTYQNPLIVVFIIGFGIISAGILLLLEFVNIDKKYEIILFLSFFLFLLLINTIIGTIFLIKILALASALIFPSLAIIMNKNYFIKVVSIKNNSIDITDKPIFLYTKIIKNIFVGITRIMLISLLGGLAIAALLTQQKFILAIQLFSGIKIAYVLPIFIVTIYFWWSSKEEKRALLEDIKKPILFEHALLVLILMVFGIIYITRSGNFSILTISNIEEKIRLFLEKYLIARPRNKEFLVGYPLLSLVIAMNHLDIHYLKIPVIAIGTIAPITVVNTFCHIHTPFLFSLLRTFNGYWLGLFFAILFSAILFFLLKNIRIFLNVEKK